MASCRFHLGAPVEEELRRIAADEIDRALAEIEEEEPHEAIHQVRRRCKKLRALLRLVRGANEKLYDRENTALRDAARRVSDLRDATAFLETYDALAEEHGATIDVERFAPIHDGLVAFRDRMVEGQDMDEKLARLQADMTDARERVETWNLKGASGFDAFEGGLAKTYRRGRNRMEDAYDERTTEAFHEWRKRVKYHRYHVGLLQNSWDKVLEVREKELHRLSDHLGDDHNLAKLRDVLLDDPESFGGSELVADYIGILDRRRAQLQYQARALGRQCFAEPEDVFVKLMRTYWEARQSSTDPEAELLPAAVAEYSPAHSG